VKARAIVFDAEGRVGLGAIGQFSARLLALAGAEVVACDLSAARCALAAAMPGVAAAVVHGGDLEAAARPRLPQGADLVVDATGAGPVAARAMALLRQPPWDEVEHPLPRFVVQGSYAGDFTLHYPTAFEREAVILVPRNRKRADEQAVLELMAKGRLPARDLLGEPARPADAPAVYAALADPAAGRVAAVFDWSARA